MHRGSILVLAVLLLGASCDRAGGALADGLAASFLGSRLEPSHRVADLPAAVAAVLDAYGTFPMADLGAYWNPNCIHDSEHPEPDRRLVVAGISPGFVAVHYQRGGRALYSVLELFRLGPNRAVTARCIYHSSLVLDTIADLRTDFASGFELDRCESGGESHAAQQGAAAGER